MTATVPPLEEHRQTSAADTVGGLRRVGEHVALIAMLAFWAVPFTRAQGGRGVHHEVLFALILVPVLAGVRAWRAPVGSVTAALVVSATALLVCVFAPSGWYGADVAAGYVLSAAVYVVGRRYVRDDERRNLVAACICLAGLYQFEQSFLAWWGSRDPSAEMSGTFYWHNPYAAFLLPGAVIGLGLVATRRSPWTYVGWTSAPICAAGIVFSSSRATMAVLAVAWAAMLAASAFDRGHLVRVGGAVLVGGALVLILPGPPFFPHRASPLSATSDRSSAGQSLAQNGEYRTQFWRESAEVALNRPVVGGGYHTLATASALYTPSNWARSPLAHDGYLQAFSDGGLVLGAPFLFAVVVIGGWGLRRFWALVARRGRRRMDLADLGITLALLGGMAHSAVDFDWSHPSILMEAALLAACVAPRVAKTRIERHPARGWLALAGLAGLLGLLVTCVPALHQWQIDQPSASQSTAELLAEAQAPFGNYRPAAEVLREFVGMSRKVDPGQVAAALRLTRAEAGVDIHLALLRIAAAAQTGALPGPMPAARAELRHVHGSAAPYVPDLAQVAISSGDLQEAQDLLASDLRAQFAANALAPDAVNELIIWGTRLGRDAPYGCLVSGVARLGGQALVSGVPRPAATCRTPADQASTG